jgi:hypothetical protein
MDSPFSFIQEMSRCPAIAGLAMESSSTMDAHGSESTYRRHGRDVMSSHWSGAIVPRAQLKRERPALLVTVDLLRVDPFKPWPLLDSGLT